MRQIELHGKHAVGEHRFTVVDDEDYAELSQRRWKALPNGAGNHVYAVRNVKVGGVWKLERMHRVILGLGYEDPRDVDHINHNALDNRRSNLRACTRAVNGSNRQTFVHAVACGSCQQTFDYHTRSNVLPEQFYCSDECRPVQSDAERWLQQGSSRVYFYQCPECSRTFTSRTERKRFCSLRCYDRFLRRGGPRLERSVKPCPMCEQHFKPTRKGQMYCGKRCRAKSDRLAAKRRAIAQ